MAEHCVVSPANSYGFMDGGIDAAYRSFFGLQIERTVQEAVARRPEGRLPVHLRQLRELGIRATTRFKAEAIPSFALNAEKVPVASAE